MSERLRTARQFEIIPTKVSYLCFIEGTFCVFVPWIFKSSHKGVKSSEEWSTQAMTCTEPESKERTKYGRTLYRISLHGVSSKMEIWSSETRTKSFYTVIRSAVLLSFTSNGDVSRALYNRGCCRLLVEWKSWEADSRQDEKFPQHAANGWSRPSISQEGVTRRESATEIILCVIYIVTVVVQGTVTMNAGSEQSLLHDPV